MILNVKFSFFFTNIILIYCMYQDIKYRKISNKILIGFFLVGSIITFTEDFDIYNNIFNFVLTKVIFFIIVFLFSFILFCLKLIGGSDGKLLIMLAFFCPIDKFNLQWIFSFFFVFLSLFLLVVLVNYKINNVLSGNNLYDMIYGLKENFTFLHKIFIILFFKFLDFSAVSEYANEKFVVKSLNLFYNEKKEKFQILTQFRPPLVILIFFTNIWMLVSYFC